ncbi:hypothetical protein Tsp_06306 [Trichinella spiralis]|uniref:hypothetical protein n=1 Tax=Trichinella spiralis TaxID=6334 RepID=UPI0001EFBCEB|nr:hypothetical protein Tsp_06306 [Trichinella spiralis]
MRAWCGGLFLLHTTDVACCVVMSSLRQGYVPYVLFKCPCITRARTSKQRIKCVWKIKCMPIGRSVGWLVDDDDDEKSNTAFRRMLCGKYFYSFCFFLSSTYLLKMQFQSTSSISN